MGFWCRYYYCQECRQFCGACDKMYRIHHATSQRCLVEQWIWYMLTACISASVFFAAVSTVCCAICLIFVRFVAERASRGVGHHIGPVRGLSKIQKYHRCSVFVDSKPTNIVGVIPSSLRAEAGTNSSHVRMASRHDRRCTVLQAGTFR